MKQDVPLIPEMDRDDSKNPKGTPHKKPGDLDEFKINVIK